MLTKIINKLTSLFFLKFKNNYVICWTVHSFLLCFVNTIQLTVFCRKIKHFDYMFTVAYKMILNLHDLIKKNWKSVVVKLI